MGVKFFRTIKTANLLSCLVGVYAALIVTGILHPFLGDNVLGGWDLTPHYYIYQVLLNNLRQGSLTSFDPNWFSGYPTFTFYGPAAYVVAALLHIVSFNFIPPIASFNLFIFLLPFFFLFSLSFCARMFFGASAAFFAVVFGLFFLTLAGDAYIAPAGIRESLVHGHVAAFFALCLLNLFVGLLQKYWNNFSVRAVVVMILLLTCIFLTHPLTSVFTILFLVVFAVVQWPVDLKGLSIIILSALILSSFFWYPLVSNLWLSSSTIVGVGHEDPLLFYFPKILKIRECLVNWDSNALLVFPVPALLLLICSVVGIVALLRSGLYALPFTFFVLLLVLPRNLLNYLFRDISLHYNRFIMPLWPLFLLLAIYGALEIFRHLDSLRSQFLKKPVRLIFGGLLLWGLLVAGIHHYGDYTDKIPFYYPIFSQAVSACGGGSQYPLPVKPVDRHLAYDSAIEMMDYISGLSPKGRVAVESDGSDISLLGSPHFFSTFLPWRYNIPVLSGLLAESSYTSGFILPVQGYKSSSLVWGRDMLGLHFADNNTDVTLDDALRRLGLFNARYVLASSEFYTSELGYRMREGESLEEGKGGVIVSSSRLLSFEKRIGPFSLFRLEEQHPFLEATDYKPYLFIYRSGASFREFSEEWYKNNRLIDYPVIFTERSFEELPSEEVKRLGGIILSCSKDSDLTREEYQYWEASGLQIIVLNKAASSAMPGTEKIQFVPGFNWRIDTWRLFSLIGGAEVNTRQELSPLSRLAEEVRFESEKGILVNYSFFPRWKSKDPSQTIYMATPGLMFVFGKGKTHLYFE